MAPKRFLLIVIVIIILLAIAGAAYYKMSHDTFNGGSETTDSGQELTEEDIADLIDAVSKHMLLPEGEQPVAAKIINVDELLKTQPFYRGAINGDMLLIYQGAAKAILYSPSRDILVNVGPIVLDDAPPAETPTDESSDDVTAEEMQ